MLSIFEKREIKSEPEWLRFALVVGYDEGGEGAEGEGSEDEGGEEGDEGEGEPDESTLPDNIKAILKKERDLRAAAEKKAKILARNQAGKSKAAEAGSQGDEGKGEGEGATTSPALQSKLDKLTEGFRTATLRSTIASLAVNFQDPSDVHNFLDTSQFDYVQDEDDPSNVVWDESELKAAIKSLAKSKPYLLKPAGDSSGQQGGRKPASGPKFAGSGSGRQTGSLSTSEMASRFPAMRTAVRAVKKDPNS